MSFQNFLKLKTMEDVFFNALHEGDFKIAGILVDINPISAEQTGILEEYMENAKEYLDEKQSHMEIPENPVQAEQEAFITFYVAECTEFPVLGGYYERLETLQEAMELYEKIPEGRRNGLKGIGFRLEDGSIYDGNFDLMVMGEMQTEFINEIPQYRDSPLVQKAIADMEAILLEERPEQEVSEAIEKEEPQQPMPEVKKEEKAVQTAENRNPDTAAQESGRDPEGLQKQSAEPEKAAENAPKTDRGISGVSKKQSVLNALRERQARMRAQEKEKPGQERQGQKARAKRKGEPEL